MLNIDLKEKVKEDIEKLKTMTIESIDTTVQCDEAIKYTKSCYYRVLISVSILLLPSLLIHGEILRVYQFIGPFIVLALLGLFAYFLSYFYAKRYFILRDLVFPALKTGEFLNQKFLWKYRMGYRTFIYLWSAWVILMLMVGWEERPEPIIFFSGYLMLGLIACLVSNVRFFKDVERLGMADLLGMVKRVVTPAGSFQTESDSDIYSPGDLTKINNITNAANPLSPINSSSTHHY